MSQEPELHLAPALQLQFRHKAHEERKRRSVDSFCSCAPCWVLVGDASGLPGLVVGLVSGRPHMIPSRCMSLFCPSNLPSRLLNCSSPGKNSLRQFRSGARIGLFDAFRCRRAKAVHHGCAQIRYCGPNVLLPVVPTLQSLALSTCDIHIRVDPSRHLLCPQGGLRGLGRFCSEQDTSPLLCLGLPLADDAPYQDTCDGTWPKSLVRCQLEQLRQNGFDLQEVSAGKSVACWFNRETCQLFQLLD